MAAISSPHQHGHDHNGQNGNDLPLLTVLNVDIGCVVRKNIEGWKPGWRAKNLPKESQGTVVGWTDEFSTIHGDPDVGGFPEIVRIQFPGIAGPKNYRMGFADEHWLVLVSGGTHREKKIFGKDLENLSCKGHFFRTNRWEDCDGQETCFVPPKEKKAEKKHHASKRIFWRVHSGDVTRVHDLLVHVDINTGIQPYLFPSKDSSLPWPYQTFDGKYGDTVLTLAIRYCHIDMIEMLLQAGADKYKKNEDGESAYDVAKKLIEDPGKIARRPFSNVCQMQRLKALLGVQKSSPLASGQESHLLCRPAYDVYTCNLSGTELKTSISWIIINGHSDKDQVDYCNSMTKQWEKLLNSRGDSVETILLCPTKNEMKTVMEQHFVKNTGKPTGIFVIAHGGEDDGRWVSFNPKNDEETFSWDDIVACGALKFPSQIFMVADTCYSARLGKIAFIDFQRRGDEGKESLPSFCFLGASDLPEKNFSTMFALDQFKSYRVLSRQTCKIFIENESPIILAENIRYPMSDDFNPYMFLYVPLSTLKHCATKSLQPIFSL